MAEPLGKRELLAWTLCGVLAVVAGIAYSKRSPDAAAVVAPVAAAPQVSTQLPPPEISAPLPKREPFDTAWVRVGTRQPESTIRINGEMRGALGVPRWFYARAGAIRITIIAPGCEAFDTTVTVASGMRRTIGTRMPRC